jgi:hypothetical protein
MANYDRIDPKEISSKLGANSVYIPEIDKETAKNLVQLGSPVMMSKSDKLNVYHFGSRMLRQYGRSLSEVVGYRIVEVNEEEEFRKECLPNTGSVVKYYGNNK